MRPTSWRIHWKELERVNEVWSKVPGEHGGGSVMTSGGGGQVPVTGWRLQKFIVAYAHSLMFCFFRRVRRQLITLPLSS